MEHTDEHTTEHHVDQDTWLERNWFWLVIAFGVGFVAWIDIFAPTH
jgi:hypothetical protein